MGDRGCGCKCILLVQEGIPIVDDKGCECICILLVQEVLGIAMKNLDGRILSLDNCSRLGQVASSIQR